ncbi:MAG: hypothetical protein K0S66_2725 [Sphingomonas sp.]|nr:hypothetical protein [Sphingomonas sp.]
MTLTCKRRLERHCAAGHLHADGGALRNAYLPIPIARGEALFLDDHQRALLQRALADDPLIVARLDPRVGGRVLDGPNVSRKAPRDVASASRSCSAPLQTGHPPLRHETAKSVDSNAGRQRRSLFRSSGGATATGVAWASDSSSASMSMSGSLFDQESNSVPINNKYVEDRTVARVFCAATQVVGVDQGYAGCGDSIYLDVAAMPASNNRAISPEDRPSVSASTCSLCWPLRGAGAGGRRSSPGSVAKAPTAG